MTDKKIQDLMNKGNEAVKKGRLTKAIEIFQKITESDKENFDAWYTMAMVYLDLGNFTKSAECHRKIIEIDPQAKYFRDLGLILAKSGNVDEGIEYIEIAVDRDPADDYAWYQLGNLQISKEDKMGAMMSWSQAIKINPEYKEAWESLGMINAQAGNLEQSLQCFEKALELAPADESVQQNVAFIRNKLGID